MWIRSLVAERPVKREKTQKGALEEPQMKDWRGDKIRPERWEDALCATLQSLGVELQEMENLVEF